MVRQCMIAAIRHKPEAESVTHREELMELELMDLEFHKFLFIYLFLPILDFLQIEFQNRDILLNSKKNKDKSPFSLKLVNQL